MSKSIQSSWALLLSGSILLLYVGQRFQPVPYNSLPSILELRILDTRTENLGMPQKIYYFLQYSDNWQKYIVIKLNQYVKATIFKGIRQRKFQEGRVIIQCWPLICLWRRYLTGYPVLQLRQWTASGAWQQMTMRRSTAVSWQYH